MIVRRRVKRTQLQRLEGVVTHTKHVVTQIEHLQHGDDPVKVFQLPPVEVIRQPVGRPVHQGDQQGVQVAAGGYGRPEQGRRRTAHALRRLVVEELKVADGHEGLGDPMQAVLGYEPEHRNGDGVVRVVEQAGGRRRLLAPLLNEAPGEGGGDGDSESDGHAVEEGDAAVEAGEAAGEGDEEAVVGPDGGEHGDQGEDGHGARGDLEGGGEVPVHGAALLQLEGALLRRRRDGDDAGEPDGHHSYH